jgi:hypothetical protein
LVGHNVIRDGVYGPVGAGGVALAGPAANTAIVRNTDATDSFMMQPSWRFPEKS